MTGYLFRRLVFVALALVILTLFALDRSLPAPVDPEVRHRVFAIALGGAVVALLIAFFVSRALTVRVRELKYLAGGILGGTPDRIVDDPDDDLGSLEQSITGAAKELRRLVDRLRFESARREAILSSMAEGVLAVDRELRVTFCNTSFLRAIGFRGNNFEGLPVLGLVRDTGFQELLREVLATGEARKLRFKLASAFGRTFEVQATSLEMPAGRGAIAILHDTTDLERLEQVRKDFVANVSHEFRTPLAGVIGYADTLLEGALDDTANSRKFVEIIRTNAIRLNSIAADLLVLSDLESGSDPDPEVISVRAVIDGALATVRAEAEARGVRLITQDIDDVHVSGSRLRLEQAILNLLANAIKFNRPGGEVLITAGLNDIHQVSIVISDTGVGIPSEDLPRIFERFYRIDKARSRQVGGTGLGLSIVKHVVERMNGMVQVESQLGRGSAFTLLFPGVETAQAAQRVVTET